MSRTGSEDRWAWLGRLLPREARERIFEPAMLELLARRAVEPRATRLPLGAAAFLTLIGCLPVSVRWSLIRNGSVTKLGRAFAVALAVGAAVVVVLRRLTTTTVGY